jgi:hypothetical protein
MNRLNQLLLSLLFLALLCLQAALLLQESRSVVTGAKVRINSVLDNANAATERTSSILNDVAAIASVQRKELADVEAIASRKALLRAGTDISQGVKRFNSIVSLVEQESVPKINRLLDASNDTLLAATATLGTTDRAIAALSHRAGVLLDDSNEAVKEFKLLLADENVKRALQAMAETSQASARVAAQMEITTHQVNQYLPSLLAALQATAENSVEGSKQLAVLLGSFNEKPTRLQKIYRALITLGVVAARVAR